MEQEDWQVSLKGLPYKKVVGVGESAVMVEQDNSVIDLKDIPFLNELLNKKIYLIGSQVITRRGEFSGEILDYYFNEENGQLESLLIHSDNKELFIPIENVISLGKERVIINDSVLKINDQISQMMESEQQINPLQVGSENQSSKKEALKIMLDELLKGNSINEDLFSKIDGENSTMLTNENSKFPETEKQSSKK